MNDYRSPGRSLREGLDELEETIDQLRRLQSAMDDANISYESVRSMTSDSTLSSDAATDNPIIREIVDSMPSSDAATDNPIIREIIDMVSDSDGITVNETREIVDIIISNNLNPADITAALDNVVAAGRPLTPSEAFVPQTLPIDCAPTLSSVILHQFGKHVPPGVITLRALLDGSLHAPGLLYGECLDLIIVKFCPYEPVSTAGTWHLQLTRILAREKILVDVDYDATLSEMKEALSQGKVVMVGLGVSPIWPGKTGGHVVQVLEINEGNRTVTTLDTGSRDSLDRPDGNGKVYNLEDFEKARELSDRIMISSKEAAPSTAREERAEVDNLDSGRIPEVDGGIKIAAGGVVVEVDGEFAALVSESTPSDDETRQGETDRAEDSHLSSVGGDTGTSPSAVLRDDFDKGDNTTRNNTEETQLIDSKNQSVDPASVNIEGSSPAVFSNTDDGAEGGEVDPPGA